MTNPGPRPADRREATAATTSTADPPAWAARSGWAMLAILVIGALIRLREARHSPLWFDEIYLVLFGRFPFGEALRTAAHDIHPPFGPMLVWAWRALGGESELWLKALPILLGLITIVLLERLGRAMYGAAAGLLAAALLALHPWHVRFSQEVEIYVLVALLPVGLALLGWRWIENRRPAEAIGLVLLGAIGMYTYCLTIPVLLTLAIWGGVQLRADRRALLAWLGLFVAIAVLDLPQLPVVLDQFRREGSGRFALWATRADVSDLLRHAAFGSPLVVPLLVLAAAVLLIVPRTRRATMLLVLIAVLPFAMLRVLPIVVRRDLLAFVPLVCLVLAGAVTRLRPALLAALVAIALLGLEARALQHHGAMAEAQDLDRAFGFVRAHAQDGDVVVHTETHGLLFGLYHAPSVRQRLWCPDSSRVPDFDGGLVIPDSVRVTPATFDRIARGRWWGMRVDRATFHQGAVLRAGTAAAAAMDSAAPGGTTRFGTVTVWKGAAKP